MLDDVLADLGQGHRETDNRFGVDPELVGHDLLRLLLDTPDDVVHIAPVHAGPPPASALAFQEDANELGSTGFGIGITTGAVAVI